MAEPLSDFDDDDDLTPEERDEVLRRVIERLPAIEETNWHMDRARIRAMGWWGLACWNALSVQQQRRLIEHGNLPIGHVPEGLGCNRGSEVAIETADDEAPGPRFYCRQCAVDYLLERT